MGIQVPPDSTGKIVETNSPDGVSQRQVITIGDETTAANKAAVTAAKALKVDNSGVTQPVSGTVTANIGTGNLAGITGVVGVRPTDGTNQITKTFDSDTGAGTEWNLGISLRKGASGGSVELGTSSDPVRTDPTGTTIQPISGTIQPGNTANTTPWLVTEDKTAAAPAVGQVKVAVTGTAVQLGSNALKNGIIITAKSTNTAPISLGGSGVNNTVDGTGNGYILEAGASVSFAVDNTNRIYINGTAADLVSFAGS